MINKDIWYLDGLEKAIADKNVSEFITKYFNENLQELCFEAPESIMHNEDDSKYYAIYINGGDDYDISFIIYDEKSTQIEWYDVKSDKSDLNDVFQSAFNKFLELLEKL